VKIAKYEANWVLNVVMRRINVITWITGISRRMEMYYLFSLSFSLFNKPRAFSNSCEVAQRVLRVERQSRCLMD